MPQSKERLFLQVSAVNGKLSTVDSFLLTLTVDKGQEGAATLDQIALAVYDWFVRRNRWEDV
jgi:hypothetical protein